MRFAIVEKSGVVLEVRSTAPSKEVLSVFLSPAGVGTAMNYCRLLERAIEFSSWDSEANENGLRLNAVFTLRYLVHLAGRKVECYFSIAAMTSWSSVLRFYGIHPNHKDVVPGI